MAQDSAGAVLEEIIVTAERREASLQDVPVSVMAFTPDTLREMDVVDFQDIHHVVPNLNIMPARGNNGSLLSFNIRGVGGFGVALYIDDIYFPQANASAFRTVDIESLEILRGPQGTLFGRNTTGGAIRVVTRKPDNILAGDIEVRAGELGRTDVEARLNVPLSDTVFLKGYLASLQRDGYITRRGVSGDQAELANIDDQIASVALRWIPNDDVIFDFTVRHEDSKGNLGNRVVQAADFTNAPLGFHARELNRQLLVTGQTGLIDNDPRLVLDDYTVAGYCFVEDNDPLSFENACNTFNRNDNTQVTAALNWELNDGSNLKLSLGYHDVRDDQAADWVTYGAEIRYADYTAEALTAEVLMNSFLLDGALDLVYGLNYYEVDNGTLQAVLRNHNPDQDADTRDIWGDRKETRSIGVFAQGTYHFSNDSTNLTLGVRNTSDEEDALVREWESGDFNIPGCETASSNTPANSGMAVIVRDPNCMVAVNANADWSETDWRVELDHRFSDNLMGYASVSKAYRAGTYNHTLLPFIPAANQALAPINPEKLVNTEIGFRSDWLDNRLRFNFTLYEMDFTNRQGPQLIVSPDGSSLQTLIIDLGDVDLEGWEMETSVAATENLTVSFAAGHAQGVLLEPMPPRSVFVAETPKYSANLSGRYSVPLDEGQLSVSLNYTWQDEFRDLGSQGDDQENFTDAFGILNGRIEYEWRNMTFAIGGSNLLDKSYAIHESVFASRFNGPPGPPINIAGQENWVRYGDMGPPRVIYGSVRVAFGGG